MTTEKTCDTCDDLDCAARSKQSSEHDREVAEQQRLLARMSQITHKLLVMSGKGGVGKSTVAVNLAVSLALAGKRVGLLDVDLHGPSVPRLLGLTGQPVVAENDVLVPLEVDCGAGSLRVMSIGFLLRERDDAVIWRGPRKFGVIKQFLTDVAWGELDYLVVDAPPGTGDEPLAVAQLLEGADGAVVVTTPQELAVQDVRRSIMFCRQLALPVLGVVENMSGFLCPKCHELFPIFGTDGGRVMAEEMKVPFLTSIPIEPEVVRSGDGGVPVVRQHPHSETAKAFGRIVRQLLEREPASPQTTQLVSGGVTRIAIPVSEGILASHFGHSEHFVFFDIAADRRTILTEVQKKPPPHEPGTYPKWLREEGVNLVIAGGMGSRAMSLFEQQGITVVVGASPVGPRQLVEQVLSGKLTSGANVCDH